MTYTRQDDERTLRILAAFRAGQSYGQIGDNEGLSRNQIAGIIYRIKNADAKHAELSGAEIAQHYERGEN